MSPRFQDSDLDGKAVWRVGSSCGPQLLQVTDEMWTRGTRDLRSRLAVIKRIQRAQHAAALVGYELPPKILERFASLINDTATTLERKHTGLILMRHEVSLNIRKK